jgi:hypothetical protein
MIRHESIDTILEQNKDVYEQFTFDYLFRRLLEAGLDHEEALDLVLANCSLSALVFEERVHNGYHKRICLQEVISQDLQGLLYRYCNAVSHQTNVEQMSDSIEEFNRHLLDNRSDEMIERWVKDLGLVKTFIGLKFQETILKKVAEATGLDYALASPEQEARGIDGLVGGHEVSIKPSSWKDQVVQRENLPGVLIYYRKTANGLEIEFEPSDFRRSM